MSALPSKATSPIPRPSDDPSILNRKRQRSQSMSSDASSSSKRLVADPPAASGSRSPAHDQLAEIDRDIDAYMVSQGEVDIPARIDPPSYPPPPWAAVPASEKFARVTEGCNTLMRAGQTWFLIARDWWKRWQKACTGEIDKEGSVTEHDLGAVDNSALLDSHGNLKLPLVEGMDVHFVPEAVWDRLVEWYGESPNPIPRKTIQRSLMVQLELYPPTFKVYRLAKTTSTDVEPVRTLTVSITEQLNTFNEKLACTVIQGPGNLPHYRVWRIELGEREWTSLDFPVGTIDDVSGSIVPKTSDTLEKESIQLTDSFVVEFKEEAGWLKQTGPSLTPQLPSRLPYGFSNAVPGPLFGRSSGFFDKLHSQKPSASSSASAFAPSKIVAPKPKKAIDPGTLGLGNMGNTCFMNSAIQCLAHNQELADYFLTGLFQDELNPDNPLGMGGAVAESFGDLLQRIWNPASLTSSYAPRDFKSVLQRFAPQFSGYQQHDSQELLAFLLDGLHEDLNRVLKKPYVEKPDWEGGGDVQLVQLARKSWDGYKLRNDSVIVDLFQGQYQSTLVCPECNKVSITFDPFMYLTLPLPVQKKWRHEIFYVPWDLKKPHVKIPVEMNNNFTFKDLRNLLGRWMGVPPENLITLEIFTHAIYKSLDDNVPVGDMNPGDVIVCFELPCHAQQARGYKKQPGDPVIIPVYFCDATGASSSTTFRYAGTQRNPPLFGYPLIVAFTPEEASDVSAMYDAVLRRLQRWTRNAPDLFTWEEGPLTPAPLPMPMQDVQAGLDEEVTITVPLVPPLADALTEIKPNGDVIVQSIPEPPLPLTPEEGDITDEKDFIKLNDEAEMEIDLLGPPALGPRQKGPKANLFMLKLQAGHKDYHFYSHKPWESWDARADALKTGAAETLLREGDLLYCQFDENIRAYYFGDDKNKWEHALWDVWETFEHPEYAAQKKAEEGRKARGLTLQDCLEEFTKEEKLGEDDLWYCPQCKKHQQATKRFDLWKAPDILVVHLKRFSNSRMLRDKIDAFIDFPVEGLDLSDKIGEKAAIERLLEKGERMEEFELNVSQLEESVVYDLFGVDEHIGGLGGGHYRAYALNHLTDKWYHFDDSHVTPAKASDAVNANAYLLFYRRRSTLPLGGKSHSKIQGAQSKSTATVDPREDIQMEAHLPTPPNEDSGYGTEQGTSSAHLLDTLTPWMPEKRSAGLSSAPSPDLSALETEVSRMEAFLSVGETLPLAMLRQMEPDLETGRGSPASDMADAGEVLPEHNPHTFVQTPPHWEEWDPRGENEAFRHRGAYFGPMMGFEDQDTTTPVDSSGVSDSESRKTGDMERASDL